MAATVAAFALGLSIAWYIKITAITESIIRTLDHQSEFNNSINKAVESNTKAISATVEAVEATQETIKSLLQ
jgi:hypothetical protein